MKLIHHCIYDPKRIPNAIANQFSTNTSLHKHNTRSKFDLHISACYNTKSLSFYGPSMWSKLPLYLREINNLNSFLLQYKVYLLAKL